MNIDAVNFYKNKRIVVLGAGLTGMSCVRFLQHHQMTCLLNDSRSHAVNSQEFAQVFPENSLVLGHWDIDAIAKADVVIASPGIDLDAEMLTQHIAPACSLIGDVELFCQLNEKPVIAVTGSNGKSTVVSLLAHVANALNKNFALAGNVGTPVLEQIDADVEGFILELSSFQLETINSMNAVVATVLNISDDHLDRHQTLEKYSLIKQKVYQQCQFAVVNRDDRFSFDQLSLPAASVMSFGKNVPKDNEFGIRYQQNNVYLAKGDVCLVELSQLPLAGVHNALNYLAVLAIAECLAWPLNDVVTAFGTFMGLPHRCQRIVTADSISWIDDSKATNVGATVAAVEGLYPTLVNGKLILIAGGDGKGADFTSLAPVLNHHVAELITIGKDGDKINALKANSYAVNSMQAAVQKASELASAGDIVLLSPACASLDMFKNFVERGEVFTRAVQSLQEVS